jgi:DNA repair protein SbcD/Mre11
MKILHTSDWHVGRRIRGRSRAEEQRAVLSEIVGIADSRRVDVTIVAGDLFDVSSPSPTDETLVYRTLLDLAEVAPVAVIAGNHDGAGRLEAVSPLLALGRIRVVATPRPADEGGVAFYEDIGLKLALLPFVSQRGVVKVEDIMRLDPDQHAQKYEQRMRRVIEVLVSGMSTDTVNVLAGHLTAYGASPGGGERDAHVFGYAMPPQAFPGTLSYVALGHLHRQQRIPAPGQVWYSGSPLQLDFGERADEKGVLLVEAIPGLPVSVIPAPLDSGVPLVQIGGTLEQVLARAPEVEGAYVKVVLDEKPRAGLNDEVRDVIPGAVDVLIASESPGRPRRAESRSSRSPRELFAAYLDAQGVDDSAVVSLFAEIEDEVHAG